MTAPIPCNLGFVDPISMSQSLSNYLSLRFSHSKILKFILEKPLKHFLWFLGFMDLINVSQWTSRPLFSCVISSSGFTEGFPHSMSQIQKLQILFLKKRQLFPLKCGIYGLYVFQGLLNHFLSGLLVLVPTSPFFLCFQAQNSKIYFWRIADLMPPWCNSGTAALWSCAWELCG